VTSAAEDLQHDEADLGTADESGRRSRLPKVAVAVLAGLALYLALSLAVPHVVPRLAVLPKPAGRVTYEDCNGHRGARTSEVWEQRGAIWVLATFTLGGECIVG
jgi:hypothetical protein